MINISDHFLFPYFFNIQSILHFIYFYLLVYISVLPRPFQRSWPLSFHYLKCSDRYP